jgi:hypothetical protein
VQWHCLLHIALQKTKKRLQYDEIELVPKPSELASVRPDSGCSTAASYRGVVSLKNALFALITVAVLAGCSNTERGAVIGGVGGAALGTLAGGNDARNALIGGVVGTAAGALVGSAADRQGYCRYRDQYGRPYEARC